MTYDISIIIPVYNVNLYVERCLESVYNQSFKNFEVIIVNDGSTDDSGIICKNFISKNKLQNFKYYEKKNGGLSDARNYGLRYANGKYVCFLDSDDYLDSNFFSKMLEPTLEKDYKIIECEFYYKFEKNQSIEKLKENYCSIKDYLINAPVVTWNKLYKRLWLLESKVKFPKNLLYEDVNFFFKLVTFLDSINDVYSVHSPLIYYVQRTNSITNRPNQRMCEIINIYENIIEFYREKGKFQLFSQEIEYKMIRNLFCAFSRKALLIENRKIRKNVLSYYWNKSFENFPNWKKNKYLRKVSVVNMYLKVLNKPLLKLLCIF